MAKRKAAQTEDPKVASVIAGINKKFGDGIFTHLSGTGSGIVGFSSQIPTGSIGLDIAIGHMVRRPDGRWQVGIPPSRIVEIFGFESTGKTTLCLLIAANCLRLGGRVAYIDMEHSVDAPYAAQLGCSLDRIYLTQPSSGTDAMGILDMIVASNMFGLVIVDSVASLTTQGEMKGEITDNHMGETSRLMSQTLKILSSKMGSGPEKSQTTVIFTNQIRMKIGQMFGNPQVTPGGNALKFYSGLRIEVQRSGVLKHPANDAMVVGHTMKLKTVKNKMSPPYREAECPLIYGYGIDSHQELFTLAVLMGVIERNGSWYKIGDAQFQGEPAAITHLRGHPTLPYFLYDQTLSRMMASRGFQPDGSPLPGYVPPQVTTMVDMFTPNTDDGEEPDSEATQ